ncbi:hypothetical protein BPOR_0028g00040 [Botrytis porri]|uniref:Uncharacterized protein n=1 Tax=Botrytis porri TaxID=87229 RepID=A0A4Z1L3K9_9HELO|nr:hypothetical protein BPOR_0028g00040 [Botrytis porri]
MFEASFARLGSSPFKTEKGFVSDCMALWGGTIMQYLQARLRDGEADTRLMLSIRFQSDCKPSLFIEA